MHHRAFFYWGLLLAVLLGAPFEARAEEAKPAKPSARLKGEPEEADAAYLDSLLAQAEAQGLAKHPMWWRLLHYRRGVFGVKSEADGAPFFTAEKGKTRPDAELEGTIRALFGPAPEDERLQHPFCRFPARLAWLNSKLSFDFSRLPKQPCPELEEFRQRTRARSITLVFSSYYLNTPASAFGHSFIRLNKRQRPGETKHQQLLDYGVDYAAQVDTNNALIYAIKGLTGLFPGEFSKRPYYYKVREYNDYEARDLWEFELNLSQAEVDMAVAHVWELGSTFFRYFYLSENCSYHMLSVLEVANPKYELLKYVGWPAVPVDTLKALFKNDGLVGEISYRPSVRSQFRHRLGDLDGEQIDLVAKLGKDPEAPLPKSYTRDQRIRVLDAAIDYVDFRHARDLLDLDSEGSEIKQRLQSRRASVGGRSEPSKVPTPEGHPASGHDSRRFSTGPGWASDNGYYQSLKFRLSLHDLTDPRRAYPSQLSISFLSTELRYHYEDPTVHMEDFTAVGIYSLTAQDRFDSSIAWNLRVGGTRLRDAGCQDCFAALAEIGGGGAIRGWDGAFLLFMTVNNRLLGGAPIQGGIADLPLRFGIGPLAGLRIAPHDNWTFFLTGNGEYLPIQDPMFSWGAKSTLRWQYRSDFSFAAEGKIQPEAYSAQILSSLYF